MLDLVGHVGTSGTNVEMFHTGFVCMSVMFLLLGVLCLTNSVEQQETHDFSFRLLQKARAYHWPFEGVEERVADGVQFILSVIVSVTIIIMKNGDGFAVGDAVQAVDIPGRVLPEGTTRCESEREREREREREKR